MARRLGHGKKGRPSRVQLGRVRQLLATGDDQEGISRVFPEHLETATMLAASLLGNRHAVLKMPMQSGKTTSCLLTAATLHLHARESGRSLHTFYFINAAYRALRSQTQERVTKRLRGSFDGIDIDVYPRSFIEGVYLRNASPKEFRNIKEQMETFLQQGDEVLLVLDECHTAINRDCRVARELGIDLTRAGMRGWADGFQVLGITATPMLHENLVDPGFDVIEGIVSDDYLSLDAMVESERFIENGGEQAWDGVGLNAQFMEVLAAFVGAEEPNIFLLRSSTKKMPLIEAAIKRLHPGTLDVLTFSCHAPIETQVTSMDATAFNTDKVMDLFGECNGHGPRRAILRPTLVMVDKALSAGNSPRTDNIAYAWEPFPRTADDTAAQRVGRFAGFGKQEEMAFIFTSVRDLARIALGRDITTQHVRIRNLTHDRCRVELSKRRPNEELWMPVTSRYRGQRNVCRALSRAITEGLTPKVGGWTREHERFIVHVDGPGSNDAGYEELCALARQMGIRSPRTGFYMLVTTERDAEETVVTKKDTMYNTTEDGPDATRTKKGRRRRP